MNKYNRLKNAKIFSGNENKIRIPMMKNTKKRKVSFILLLQVLGKFDYIYQLTLCGS